MSEASKPSGDGTPPQPPERGGKKRRHRRVTAAPTHQPAADVSETPDADWSSWFAQPADGSTASGRPRVAGASGKPVDERDRWYLEQRPPHWQ